MLAVQSFGAAKMMWTFRLAMALVGLAFLVAGVGHAQAGPITLSDFSGSETVIAPTSGGNGVTISHVRFTNNSDATGFGRLGVDPTPEFEFISERYWGHIPGASLGAAVSDQTRITDFEMEFLAGITEPVNRVGMLLHGHPNNRWRFSVFGNSNSGPVLLDSIEVMQNGTDQGFFVGLEVLEDIFLVRVQELSPLKDQNTDFDDFRFESIPPLPAPIPEPSSLALLTIGAIGLFGHGWRRKRKLSA
jgi:hypothetical protein